MISWKLSKSSRNFVNKYGKKYRHYKISPEKSLNNQQTLGRGEIWYPEFSHDYIIKNVQFSAKNYEICKA